MKLNILFLLAFIALGRTQANQDCSEGSISDRTSTCYRNFMSGDFDTEDICAEVMELENCFVTFADECADDVHREHIDKELQLIKRTIGDQCPNKALDKIQEKRWCSPASLSEKLNNCYAGVLRLLKMDNPSNSVLCSEFKTVESCLRSAADDCLSRRHRALTEEQFRKLNASIAQICAHTDATEENCMEQHRNYIYGCLEENQIKAISHFVGRPNSNSNVMKCTLYNWISECAIKRTEVKCGVVASNILREELNEPSELIKDACDAANMNYRH